MCCRWLISREGLVLARGQGAVARGIEATSNVAEYLALIEGLEGLADPVLTTEVVIVSGDARVIIDQMRGAAAVNASSMLALYARAYRLAQRFPNLFWRWTPRKYNKEADALTRYALRQARQNHGVFEAVLRAIDPRKRPEALTRRFLPLIDLRVYHPR